MANRKFRPEDVAAALRRTRGNMTAAARVLDCHRHTVSEYVHHYPICRQAAEEGKAVRVDIAEAALDQKLRGEIGPDGEVIEPPDWSAVKFVLMTLGRDRGYTWYPGEGLPTKVVERERTVIIERLKELPEQERRALRQQLFKARELSLGSGDVVDGEWEEKG